MPVWKPAAEVWGLHHTHCHMHSSKMALAHLCGAGVLPHPKHVQLVDDKPRPHDRAVHQDLSRACLLDIHKG